MGFQNKMKTDEIDYNQSKNIGSKGRTSKTSEVVNGSTKAQYERLGTSNAVDTSGKTYNREVVGSYSAPLNQKEAMSSNQRLSTVNAVLGTQTGQMVEHLNKTGKMEQGTK